jgi:hypothetical protein
MSFPSITFLGSTESELRTWLNSHSEGHERGAFVLFKKFNRFGQTVRYVATEIVLMDDDWVLESSPSHVRINMRKLPQLYFRCESEGLELGFAHNHPSGALLFSTKDNLNEKNILQGYAGCNGDGVSLVALVLCDDHWIARIRHGSDRENSTKVRHVGVVGSHLDVHLTQGAVAQSETLKRQEAAFGAPFNAKLNSLHAVVVGAGGTGSSLATMLARAGVGELVIVDGDELEGSNLNRVRGYKTVDVGSNKAETLAAFINSLGLTCRATAIAEYLHESPAAIDALSGADVIFGCTDDIAGRDLLNQAVYYYGVPLFDLGLTGKIDLDVNGDPFLLDHRGRVSLVLPELGSCLRCQGVVTDKKLEFEEALRHRPELKELDADTLEKEYYLTGGAEQAPGIGPFTSMTADLAVSAFMNLIRPFWNIPSDLRTDNIWVDFVHLSIHSNSRPRDPNCYCCETGAITLADEKGFRLGTPSLGRVNNS